jgi:hypothetical protein
METWETSNSEDTQFIDLPAKVQFKSVFTECANRDTPAAGKPPLRSDQHLPDQGPLLRPKY